MKGELSVKRAVKTITALLLSFSILVCGLGQRVYASETSGSEASETSGGKYISEVFIAYGKTEAEAKKWLTDNGWEALKNPSNVGLGKASSLDEEIAAVIGIRRTDNADEAITDMAVMNMNEDGYSYSDYESLVNKKKADIDEFIRTFIPTIEEYRKNYKGEGTEFGKKRADLAYKFLNMFYDGEVGGEYAINDTGMHLGDLFLSPLKQEIGDDAYNRLSAEDKHKYGDLQQIILETCGTMEIFIEELLAIATDASETTWIERLQELEGDELSRNIGKYVPSIAGQDLAESAIMQLLAQEFGDAAATLAQQWQDVRSDIQWFESYNEKYDLWDHEGETEEEYTARLAAFFKDLEKNDKARYTNEYNRYMANLTFYETLYEIPYTGEWGETLAEFFNPQNGKNYGADENYFLPFAAALSEGQRASLNRISFRDLIYVGFMNEDGLEQIQPNLDEVFKADKDGNKPLELSVYDGMDRAIFRKGVALTSGAMMEKNLGRGDPYAGIWGNYGAVAIAAYAGMAVGLGMMVAGGVMMAKGVEMVRITTLEYGLENLEMCETKVRDLKVWIQHYANIDDPVKAAEVGKDLAEWQQRLYHLQTDKYYQVVQTEDFIAPSITGRWVMGIGVALLLISAGLEAYNLWKYYNRDMKPIPRMIVDEADIVTYETDDKGNKTIKNITFDQFVYYNSVKCNRPQIGKICDWQDGVEEYKDHNCYDVADLNCDYGKEWLALYTNKSLLKGDPILADSLQVKYGSEKMPAGCTKNLHFFTYTYAIDLGDTAYSYSNDEGGVYVFWDADTEAGAIGRGERTPATASTFSPGQFALGAAAGLVIGAAGAFLIMYFRKKKENKMAEATA